MTDSNLEIGHRERLRQKFLISGHSFQDYELLEMILFLAFPRKDTKNLAKILLKKFSSIKNVMNADTSQLKSIAGVGNSVISVLNVFKEVNRRMLLDDIKNIEIKLSNITAVEKYCRANIGYLNHEEVLALFLNNSANLICEEVINTGCVDEVKVYKNLLITKATQNAASGIILVHNHPSGNIKPSIQDIQLTKDVGEILEKVGLKLIDHIIVSKNGSFSFGKNGLLDNGALKNFIKIKK